MTALFPGLAAHTIAAAGRCLSSAVGAEPGATDSAVASGWRVAINLFVAGDPKAQPRPRAFARKFGNGTVQARVYDAGTAEGWKGAIALAIRPHLPSPALAGAVRVDADFIFARPKCLKRKCDPAREFEHCQKPDRDNLEKALLDCLKTLGVFDRDDSQVCAGEVRKLWAAKHATTGGLRLTISVLESMSREAAR